MMNYIEVLNQLQALQTNRYDLKRHFPFSKPYFYDWS